MTGRALVVALAITLTTGCVGKKKYTALGEQLADEEKRAADLERQLGESKGREADLTAALEEARNQVSQLESEREALQERQAQLLEELKGKARMQASIEEMQRALAELDLRKAQADARVAEYKDLLERFKKLIDAGTLRVKIVDGRMVVELATDVLFDSGRARLSTEGRDAVTSVAAVLADIPDRRYQIEGHTDSVPISTAQFPSNWELASARALTVVRAMIDAGLGPDRVSAASFGEHRPAGPNATDEGKRANRRIEIVVVPDLSGLPGFDDLASLEESGG